MSPTSATSDTPPPQTATRCTLTVSSSASPTGRPRVSALPPPYIIYANHHHKEIVAAIRGLNLVGLSDYKVLMYNRLGMQMFDGGFVHHGLLKAATWVLNREAKTIKKLLKENADYRLVFCRHSLGSGVVTLMAVIVVNHRKEFGGSPVTGYSNAIAPAWCMSLNLAVKYRRHPLSHPAGK